MEAEDRVHGRWEREGEGRRKMVAAKARAHEETNWVSPNL
jgi:hypothetical protein